MKKITEALMELIATERREKSSEQLIQEKINKYKR